MEEYKTKLRKKIYDFLKITYDDSLFQSKIEESRNKTFIHNDKFYRDKVLVNVTYEDIEKFNVDIEFCDSNEQHDLWEYFRIHTSSIRTRKNIGRCIRILVKHRLSNKYIGIIALGSDIYRYDARDKFIGWDNDNKKSKINWIMNITTCVGLQPISYNLNIGKLLVAICFSDTVLNRFKEKYNHDIACITTFSINGKSIQYDRMKDYISYIGETQGYAFTNIPDKLYKDCINFLNKINDTRTLSYANKRFKVNKVMNYLEIEYDNLHKRGVYIGFTSKDSKAYLKNEIDTFTPTKRTLDDICKWWKERWAFQRYNHLVKEGRLRNKLEFHNAFKEHNVAKVKKSNEKLKKTIGEEEYKFKQNQYMNNYRNKEIEIDIKRQVEAPLNMKWLAGFMDGDGSINLVDKKYLRVEIGQCNPYPLILLQSNYGGNLAVKSNTGENSRKIFKWAINCSKVEKVVNDIKDHVILEYDHIVQCVNYFKCESEDSKNKVIYVFQSKIKKYDDVLYDRINYEYIAGLFDAEGEVSLEYHYDGRNSKYSVSITQQSSLGLLHGIVKFLGYGKVDKSRMKIYRKDQIQNFLECILPYLVVKRQQCKTLLSFFSGKIYLNEGVRLIKDDKHKTYEKEIKFYTRAKVSREKKVVETSENHNEDDKMYETRLKLKVGTAIAKHKNRKVTDDQIIEIRNIHMQGETFTNIAHKFGLSRQYVTAIVNKKVLTLEELQDGDIVKANLDELVKKQEIDKNLTISKKDVGVMRSGISKRKVPASTVLELMKFKLDNPSITLVQLLNKFKNTALTMDMVKNYIGGSSKLYEIEFPVSNYTWEDYTNMYSELQNLK